MEKEYLLTLKIAAHIPDKIEGTANDRELEYTHEIVNQFLARPHLLARWHKTLAVETFLPDFIADMEHKNIPLNLESESHLLFELVEKLEPGPAAYLLDLIRRKPAHTKTNLRIDRQLNLIWNHVNDLEITGFSFKTADED